MFATLGSFSVFFVIAVTLIVLGFIFEEELVEFEEKLSLRFKSKKGSTRKAVKGTRTNLKPIDKYDRLRKDRVA